MYDLVATMTGGAQHLAQMMADEIGNRPIISAESDRLIVAGTDNVIRLTVWRNRRVGINSQSTFERNVTNTLPFLLECLSNEFNDSAIRLDDKIRSYLRQGYKTSDLTSRPTIVSFDNMLSSLSNLENKIRSICRQDLGTYPIKDAEAIISWESNLLSLTRDFRKWLIEEEENFRGQLASIYEPKANVIGFPTRF